MKFLDLKSMQPRDTSKTVHINCGMPITKSKCSEVLLGDLNTHALCSYWADEDKDKFIDQLLCTLCKEYNSDNLNITFVDGNGARHYLSNVPRIRYINLVSSSGWVYHLGRIISEVRTNFGNFEKTGKRHIVLLDNLDSNIDFFQSIDLLAKCLNSSEGIGYHFVLITRDRRLLRNKNFVEYFDWRLVLPCDSDISIALTGQDMAAALPTNENQICVSTTTHAYKKHECAIFQHDYISSDNAMSFLLNEVTV